MARRLLAGLVAVAAILALRAWDKSSTREDVKVHLLHLCGSDEDCAAAVRKHYDGCFEATYKNHALSSASRFDSNGLVRCINQKADKPYFMVTREGK
jgi:hypothetical protein